MTLTWGVNTLVGEKVVVCTLNKKILSCKLLHDGFPQKPFFPTRRRSEEVVEVFTY